MTFDWTVKVTDIAIVIATMLGPILAVQAQKYLEKIREVKSRRIILFRTLMATRATTVSPDHVEALNAIPIEFAGSDKHLKEIINKWKAYLDHLGKDAASPGWAEKKKELLVDLLHDIAQFLGYEFNTVEIANEVYWPKAHAWIETERATIRKGLADLINGKLALPLEIKAFPTDPVAVKEQEELRQLLLRWLKGEVSVAVDVKNDSQ